MLCAYFKFLIKKTLKMTKAYIIVDKLEDLGR